MLPCNPSNSMSLCTCCRDSDVAELLEFSRQGHAPAQLKRTDA